MAITDKVTCAELAEVVKDRPDRVAVLVLLRDVPGKPGGEIQFVTYGKEAADKVEAYRLKEWVKREVFGGTVPPAVSHESFIAEAAANKEKLDAVAAERDALVERERLLEHMLNRWMAEDRACAAIGPDCTAGTVEGLCRCLYCRTLAVLSGKDC